MSMLKYISIFLLIFAFGNVSAQVFLSDLQYADTANYMVLTDSIGEQRYIHKDSISWASSLQIVQDSVANRVDSNYIRYIQDDRVDTIEYYVDGLVWGDQLLDLDGNDLSITNGNTVDLSEIVPNIDGVEMVMSVGSYTPAFTLPADMNRINIHINGVRCKKVASSPAHFSEYYITGNTIFFYETLDNDFVSILIY